MRNAINEIFASVVISVIVALVIVGATHIVYTLFGMPINDTSTVIRYSMLGSFLTVNSFCTGRRRSDSNRGDD